MIIAIDGFSSCGKSTLAKDIAKALDLIYIDTGAMYRAVTLFFLENNIDYSESKSVQKALVSIDITFQRIDGQNTTFLNGRNVEDEIRGYAVTNKVSEVSAIPAVREKLVAQQRSMASDGLVMDGRDIGTVVFPNATYKFFITSNVDVRARRRFDELKNKGKDVDFEQVKANLISRDTIDSSREMSPLRKADDAIEIDNSDLTKEQQLALILGYIDEAKK